MNNIPYIIKKFSIIRPPNTPLVRLVILALLLLMAGGMVQTASADTADDYILYYRFDENKGTTLYNDNSTTDYNCAWNGNNSQNWSASGIYSSGGNFSPPNLSVVNCNNAASLNISGNFTVTAWFLTLDNRTTSINSILGTRSSASAATDKSFDLGITNNKIHADIGNGSYWITTAAEASYVYQRDTWYHVAVSINNTEYNIYLNGSKIGSGTYEKNNPMFSNTTHILGIGNYRIFSVSSNPQIWNGTIDDVRVYDRILNNNEVNLSMNISYNISSCRTLTASSITYNLTQSITKNNTCLTTFGDDITIDGAGYKIQGEDATNWYKGIDIASNNVTVKNINVSDLKVGIQFSSGSNTTLTNVTLISNYYGVYGGSNNSLIAYSNISDNTIGIRATYIANNNYSDNVFYNNPDYSIYFGDNTSESNLIQNNYVYYGNNKAIQVSGNNSTVINNTVEYITGDGSDGIHLNTAFNATVRLNTVTSQGQGTGIDLNGATNSLVEYNNFTSLTTGIELDVSSDNNIIQYNRVNQSEGIHLWWYHNDAGTHPPRNNTIFYNTLIGTGTGNGVYLQNNVSENIIEFNNATKYTTAFNIENASDTKGCGNYGNVNDSTSRNYLSNTTQPCYIWRSENLTNIGRLASSGVYIYNLTMTIIPSSFPLNLTIRTYNTTGDYRKLWNESSTNASVTTAHTIGDFPAGRLINISVDGTVYGTYQSNATGYIVFTYTGGYSEHEFEAGLSNATLSRITLTAVTAGAAGNSITTTETLGNASFGAGTLTGGSDGSQWNSEANTNIPSAIDFYETLGTILKIAVVIAIIAGVIAVIRGIQNRNAKVTIGGVSVSAFSLITLIVLYSVTPYIGSQIEVSANIPGKTAATGILTFTGNVSDTELVNISTYRFEFNTDSSITTGNIPVNVTAQDGGLANQTIAVTNLTTAIQNNASVAALVSAVSS